MSMLSTGQWSCPRSQVILPNKVKIRPKSRVLAYKSFFVHPNALIQHKINTYGSRSSTGQRSCPRSQVILPYKVKIRPKSRVLAYKSLFVHPNALIQHRINTYGSRSSTGQRSCQRSQVILPNKVKIRPKSWILAYVSIVMHLNVLIQHKINTYGSRSSTGQRSCPRSQIVLLNKVKIRPKD